MKERGSRTGECLDGWTLQKSPVTRQKDGSSCSLFVRMNAEALLKDADPTVVQQEHMGDLRKYIKKRLIEAVPN